MTALAGVAGDAHGIVKGYVSGNLSFTANLWGGVVNAGEFELSGTQFTPNAEETKYYALNGQRVALARNDVVFYLHGDHLGSASLTTDASGAVVSEMRYYPYGETRSGTVPTDRKYTGQREETGQGLYDYGARRYDPYINRWIQLDTIIPEPSNPQSLSRYTCVYNNPLRYVDSTGHFAVASSAMLVSGIIGGAAAAIGSVAVQAMQGVDWGNVGIAAGVGFVAGGLAPVFATTTDNLDWSNGTGLGLIGERATKLGT